MHVTVSSFDDKSQTSRVRCLGSLLARPRPAPPWSPAQRVTQGRGGVTSRHSPHSNGKMSAIKSLTLYYELSELIKLAEAGGPQEAGALGVFVDILSSRRIASLPRVCWFSGLLWKLCSLIILCLYFTTVIWPGGMFPHFWHIAQLLLSCRYCSITHHIISFTLTEHLTYRTINHPELFSRECNSHIRNLMTWQSKTYTWTETSFYSSGCTKYSNVKRYKSGSYLTWLTMQICWFIPAWGIW